MKIKQQKACYVCGLKLKITEQTKDFQKIKGHREVMVVGGGGEGRGGGGGELRNFHEALPPPT